MIITTVIVFLKDLLPIFILFCYLSVFFEHQKIKLSLGLITAIAATTSTFVLFIMAEVIADWFEGAGLELTFASLLGLFYFSGVYLSIVKSKHINQCSILLCVCTSSFIALRSASFLVFFSVTEQHVNNLQNVILGCIVGLGICISFSALFRFLLIEIKQSHYKWLVTIFWSAFLAGQTSEIVLLLSQVDIISLGTPLFDTSKWIKDSSEYGHILNALIGYESSPTLAMAVAYAIAFVIPMVFGFILKLKISLREVAHA